MALFTLRVELTEAFLQCILPSGSGGSRDRPERVLRVSGHPVEPSPKCTDPPATPAHSDPVVLLSPTSVMAVNTAECGNSVGQ
jgi:hypothetical protein